MLADEETEAEAETETGVSRTMLKYRRHLNLNAMNGGALEVRLSLNTPLWGRAGAGQPDFCLAGKDIKRQKGRAGAGSPGREA